MLEARLSHADAREAYSHLTWALNAVSLYERFATRRLIGHARLEQAESVFEFGCGTGRFAEEILRHQLPARARYTACDITPEMVRLTEARLATFASRVTVKQSDGGAPAHEPPASCDRWVANFVLDLLSDGDIRAVLSEAHRMLRPGGLICLSSLAPAQGPLSQLCTSLWSAVYALRPSLVGGCRPISLEPFLEPSRWRIEHRSVVVPFGFALEVAVAARS
jgi:ubiquinone/menaquinone biosynthesis C-methylase UbiE